ncbi:MAG: hypothetical protein KC414_06560, partial [Romboutsia sp.]|nr:hypothetical protein [Romboutsia sp.]
AETGIFENIHNTQDEFFNGELSGSVLLVSDGNLTDKDCLIFLDPNTVEIQYKPILYTVYDVNEGVYLNSLTIPPSGTIYLLHMTRSTTRYAGGSGEIDSGFAVDT